MLTDAEFRARLRAEIVSDAGDRAGWSDLIPGPGEAPDRSAFTVSFVVVANSSRVGNNWLPFFSRLNLMQQGRTLDNLGIRYTLDRVDAA